MTLGISILDGNRTRLRVAPHPGVIEVVAKAEQHSSGVARHFGKEKLSINSPIAKLNAFGSSNAHAVFDRLCRSDYVPR